MQKKSPSGRGGATANGPGALGEGRGFIRILRPHAAILSQRVPGVASLRLRSTLLTGACAGRSRRWHKSSIGRIQRGMVERRLLILDSAIGQPVCEEVDQVSLIPGAEPEFLNTLGLLWVGKVPTAVVEIDDVSQRGLAAVVKVRCGQRVVAE